jgi:hypothetical protein
VQESRSRIFQFPRIETSRSFTIGGIRYSDHGYPAVAGTLTHDHDGHLFKEHQTVIGGCSGETLTAVAQLFLTKVPNAGL